MLLIFFSLCNLDSLDQKKRKYGGSDNSSCSDDEQSKGKNKSKRSKTIKEKVPSLLSLANGDPSEDSGKFCL